MINGKTILSIVTARKGSVSVRNKNFRMILGRPLVQWSILHSIGCPYIDMTVVSSNCDGVKEAVDSLQKEIEMGWKEDTGRFYSFPEFPVGKFMFVQRPDEMCSGTSKNEEALIHAYHHVKNNHGIDSDIIVNLQPTSPVRHDSLIAKCLLQFDKEQCDSLFTASKHTPFFFKKIEDQIIADWDIANRPMRHEISDWRWHDAGNVYAVSKEHLLKNNCRLGGKMSVVELTQEQSIQIDTELDFRIAEMVMEIQRANT
jgi:CMP-N,N'-diacetyllegionaminic acid synthase